MIYVVGFMLDEARENVVLIEKNRPAWQAGKLNGVCGKVELGEHGNEAMAREFDEETGLFTLPHEWDRICTITWPDDLERVGATDPPSVLFYRSIYTGTQLLAFAMRTKTDEAVRTVPVSSVPGLPVVPNLRWLIPLAAYTADAYEPFTLHATVAEVLA